MSYYFPTTVELPFNEAIERTISVLAEHGFGVLTTINVKETLKKKIDVEFRPYTILGACNPKFAHQALQSEPHIGTMLPCNVIVQDLGNDKIEIAAVDPMASMAAVKNTALAAIAEMVKEQLQTVIREI